MSGRGDFLKGVRKLRRTSAVTVVFFKGGGLVEVIKKGEKRQK